MIEGAQAEENTANDPRNRMEELAAVEEIGRRSRMQELAAAEDSMSDSIWGVCEKI